MRKVAFAAISAVLLMTACAGAALAADKNVTTKKLQIKDNVVATKRQIQVQSMDPTIAYGDADAPGTKGATVQVYSATDDLCVHLYASPLLWTDNGKTWKYNDKVTKTQVSITKGKVQVKLQGDIDYTLMDNHTQGAVNVKVQFGAAGTPICMHCAAPAKKDTDTLFLAQNCVAAACDAGADTCDVQATFPGLHGALTKTTGRFNYASTIGVAGADTQCNIKFAGTHACTYAELQNAQTLGQLAGLEDGAGQAVTSFWAIDSAHPGTAQCGSVIPWDYATAHTGHFADIVTLNNATGVLDPLTPAAATAVNFCLNARWVGCCK